jgi:hypothetical protein
MKEEVPMSATKLVIAGVGVSIGLAMLPAAEGYASTQQGGPACDSRPIGPDFGPPERCGNESNHQHPSGKTITTLATAGSTVAPVFTFVLFDPEHYQLDQFEFPNSTLQVKK